MEVVHRNDARQIFVSDFVEALLVLWRTWFVAQISDEWDQLALACAHIAVLAGSEAIA